MTTSVNEGKRPKSNFPKKAGKYGNQKIEGG